MANRPSHAWLLQPNVCRRLHENKKILVSLLLVIVFCCWFTNLTGSGSRIFSFACKARALHSLPSCLCSTSAGQKVALCPSKGSISFNLSRIVFLNCCFIDEMSWVELGKPKCEQHTIGQNKIVSNEHVSNKVVNMSLGSPFTCMCRLWNLRQRTRHSHMQFGLCVSLRTNFKISSKISVLCAKD